MTWCWWTPPWSNSKPLRAKDILCCSAKPKCSICFFSYARQHIKSFFERTKLEFKIPFSTPYSNVGQRTSGGRHAWGVHCSVNRRRWRNGGLLLVQRRRRRINLKPPLRQRLVFAGCRSTFTSSNRQGAQAASGRHSSRMCYKSQKPLSMHADLGIGVVLLYEQLM